MTMIKSQSHLLPVKSLIFNSTSFAPGAEFPSPCFGEILENLSAGT